MASFTAWTEDEKRVIAAHSAAILVEDPTFCVGADGPATDSQRLLVARHFPRAAILAPTRRKARVFASLDGINKRRFETIVDFNAAYDNAFNAHAEVKVRCNDTCTETDSNLYTAYNEFCAGTAPKNQSVNNPDNFCGT